MDLPGARFSVELTQPPVDVNAGQVLIMVEILRSAASARCTTTPPTCCASPAAG